MVDARRMMPLSASSFDMMTISIVECGRPERLTLQRAIIEQWKINDYASKSKIILVKVWWNLYVEDNYNRLVFSNMRCREYSDQI